MGKWFIIKRIKIFAKNLDKIKKGFKFAVAKRGNNRSFETHKR